MNHPIGHLPARDFGASVISVNLHDWIDEVCDVLDIDVDLDEALVLDVAREAAHNVVRPAAPITTYLLGYAAGARDLAADEVERLAAAVNALADQWERPPDAPDPDDINDEVPDDTSVDHSADVFEDA